jgi:hypothetical protein
MTEIRFDFLNLNSILLLLCIFLVGGYLYYEIIKINRRIDEIDGKIKSIGKLSSSLPFSQSSYMDQSTNVIEQEDIYQSPIDNQTNSVNPISSESPVSSERLGISESPVNNEILEKDDQWEMINEQMRNEDKNIKDDDSYSESSSSRSSRSSRSSESSRSSDLPKSIKEKIYDNPENNNASIDDILSDKNIITDNSLSDILNVDSDLSKIDEFMKTVKKENELKIIPKDYNDMTVSELKKVLVDMNLPVSGNKTKLIERIKENKLK